MKLQENIRKVFREELDKKQKVFYTFSELKNHWVDDNDRSYHDEFFDNKDYEDFHFDNFYDMDEMFGHENSLFGTRGLPVGHPDRSSKSFDYYNKKFGPMIVRVIKNNDLQENIRKVLREESQKQSRLLSNIKEDGLYQVMQDTGLTLKQIKSKIGELPREVFETYIKDFLEKDEMGLDLSIQISPSKIVDSFYLSDDVVTIELNEVDSRGRVVAGSFERLSALSDEEIFSLVNEMSQINFDNYFDLW